MVLISKLILLFINFSILSFLAVLISGQVQASHDLTSWAFFYHVLAFAYLTIRGIFWLLTIISTADWDIFTFYFLYWIPNPIELGSFLILPLFLLQILYPSAWKKHWPFWKPIAYGFMASIVIFQIIWSLLSVWDDMGDAGDRANHTESIVSDFFRWMNAISFFVLSCIQLVYAIELSNMDEKTYGRYMLAPKKIINYVNGVLILSFITRSLYQLAAIFDLALLPDIPLQGYDDVSFIIVIFFTLWDYIPTILIITTITSRAMGNTKDKSQLSSSSKNSKSSVVSRRGSSSGRSGSSRKKSKNVSEGLAAGSSIKNSKGSIGGDRDDMELSSSQDSSSDRYLSNGEDSSLSNTGSKNAFVTWKQWLFNETTRDIRSKYESSSRRKDPSASSSTSKRGLVTVDEENPLLSSSNNNNNSSNNNNAGLGGGGNIYGGTRFNSIALLSGYGSTGYENGNNNGVSGIHANSLNESIRPSIQATKSSNFISSENTYGTSNNSKYNFVNDDDGDDDDDNDDDCEIDYGSLDRFEAPSLRRSMKSMLIPTASTVANESDDISLYGLKARWLQSQSQSLLTPDGSSAALPFINPSVVDPPSSTPPRVLSNSLYNQTISLSHYRYRRSGSNASDQSDSDFKLTAPPQGALHQ